MNWWRGIIRLWIVFACVWVGLVGFIAYFEYRSAASWDARCEAAAIQRPTHANGLDLTGIVVSITGCGRLPLNYPVSLRKDQFWTNDARLFGLGVAFPLAVLIGLYALRWVVRGLRP